MKEQKLLGVEKNLDKKFLKFYTAKYETDGKPRDYFFVSRHDEKDLAINNEKVVPTAVEAFTYSLNDDGDIKVIMIKEFRSALGKYVYSFCAGLIDNDELPEDACQREIYEELGAQTNELILLQDYPLPMCAGMTDEANYMFIAQVSNLDKQHLEESEDIEVVEFDLDELENKVRDNKIYLTISGYLGVVSLLNYLK